MTAHALDAIPWSDLIEVKIRTTDDGPWGEDVFWEFHLADSYFELPGAWISGDDLSHIAERLWGLDYPKVIEAMASTDHAEFVVWRKAQSVCTVNVLSPS